MNRMNTDLQRVVRLERQSHVTRKASTTITYSVQNSIKARWSLMAPFAVACSCRKHRRHRGPDLQGDRRSAIQRFATKLAPRLNGGNICSRKRVLRDSQRDRVRNRIIPAGRAAEGYREWR